MTQNVLSILMVEDNLGDARLTAHMLKDPEVTRFGEPKFKVTHADRLAEALQHLSQTVFDSILLDLSLPDSQGLETAERVLAAAPGMPIVVMSGLGDGAVALKAVQAGVQDYLVKGHVDGYSLARTIRYSIERKHTEAALRDKEVHVEKALRESEQLREFNESILNTMSEGLLLQDADGRIAYVNSSLQSLLGYTLEELLGRELTVILPAQGQSTPSDDLAQTASGEANHETYLVAHDGRQIPVLVSATPYVRQGRVGALSIFVDMSEQKRTMDALRASEEKFRLIVAQSADGIILADETGNIIEWNRALEQITGLSSAEALGQPWWKLMPLEALQVTTQDHTLTEAQYVRQVHELLSTGQAPWLNQPHVLEFQRRDGLRRFAEVNAFAIPGDRGYLVGGIIRDITTRRATEERLTLQSAALEAAANAIVITDRHGVITWVNPAFSAITGYDAEEAVGQTSAFLKTSQHDGEFYQQLWQTILSGDVWHGEITNRRKDGSLYIEEMTITPVRSRTGEISNFIGIKQDVSERKKREREQHLLFNVAAAARSVVTSADLYFILLDQVKAILQATGSAVALPDPRSGEAVIQFANGDLAAAVGNRWPPGEGLFGHVLTSGQPVYSLPSDAMQSPGPAALEGLAPAAACVPLPVEGKIVGALWIGRATPLNSEEIRLLEAIIDMVSTALHRTTLFDYTREQEAQIRQIIETVPVGMILLDREQHILLANTTARLQLSELSSTESGELLTHLGEQPIGNFLRAAGAEAPWQEITLASGRKLFEVATWHISAGRGSEGWVIVLQDVTEERRRQEHLQAQDRLATVGQLAAGIAHDFNNIMSVITLTAGSLGMRRDHPRFHQSLQTIKEQALLASNLIRQILDFSRRSVSERAPTQLLPFVQRVTLLLERTLAERIKITLTAGEGDYIVLADPTQLQQVLMNLAVNARDAMPKGGDLHFELRRFSLSPGQSPPLPNMEPGDWISLAVSDTGTGIRPEDVSHIFEPFFTTKEPSMGTGLGLAQVYGIILQHGGDIAVESRLGEGTTFYIYLPISTAQPQAAAPENEALPPGSMEQGVVLLVEDNPHVRLAMEDSLSVMGYRVLLAGNGHQALKLLKEHLGEIDLVVTDTVMPEMDGLELYSILRKLAPSMKVLMMSGHPLDEASQKLLETGTAAWLRKPFSSADLARKIREMLVKGEAP